jgi:hypothetical protein
MRTTGRPRVATTKWLKCNTLRNSCRGRTDAARATAPIRRLPRAFRGSRRPGSRTRMLGRRPSSVASVNPTCSPPPSSRSSRSTITVRAFGERHYRLRSGGRFSLSFALAPGLADRAYRFGSGTVRWTVGFARRVRDWLGAGGMLERAPRRAFTRLFSACSLVLLFAPRGGARTGVTGGGWCGPRSRLCSVLAGAARRGRRIQRIRMCRVLARRDGRSKPPFRVAGPWRSAERGLIVS